MPRPTGDGQHRLDKGFLCLLRQPQPRGSPAREQLVAAGGYKKTELLVARKLRFERLLPVMQRGRHRASVTSDVGAVSQPSWDGAPLRKEVPVTQRGRRLRRFRP